MSAPIVEDVSLADLKKGLADGTIMLVDVREQIEWDAGHIPGAIFNPLSLFDPAALPADDFRLQIPRFHQPDWGLNLIKLTAFRALAADFGHTAPALAMAWVLDQGPHLIPIPGTRSAAHLADWATADSLTMAPDLRAAIAGLLPVGWAHGDRYGPDQASTVERYC